MSLLRAALLSVLLVAAYVENCDAGPVGVHEPMTCCLSYQNKPIHSSVLKTFYRTSKTCNKAGVVFVGIKGNEFCTDPTKRWVRNAMNILPELKKNPENN
ncbi:C-C motif chemokine 4-like [Protopterus annectens]|uniref:C-C motif chemokine 4-like n=1 Tax=Protopterus annectens TaxID=7888 RepID=UPI001CFBD7E8|nr:C-C motif chemokine 4-like [Protopterus annectens]